MKIKITLEHGDIGEYVHIQLKLKNNIEFFKKYGDILLDEQNCVIDFEGDKCVNINGVYMYIDEIEHVEICNLYDEMGIIMFKTNDKHAIVDIDYGLCDLFKDDIFGFDYHGYNVTNIGDPFQDDDDLWYYTINMNEIKTNYGLCNVTAQI